MLSREDGFTITEMLVSSAVMLLVAGATMTTFTNALNINDTAQQLGDSNQNLRAGTNQITRDIMMAGRIIANGGVPAPSGAGALPIQRPGPPGTSLDFSLVADPNDGTIMLPAITSGYTLGPAVNPGNTTDMLTILTVDEFEPYLMGYGAGTPQATTNQAVIATDGSSLTLPPDSPWLIGSASGDTQPLNIGDIVLFKNIYGMAIQTITAKTSTQLFFAQADPNDWFHLNQRNVNYTGTIFCLKQPLVATSPNVYANDTCDPNAVKPDNSAAPTLPIPALTQSEAFPGTVGVAGSQYTTLFRLLMITYYVDNTTTPGTPRLTKQINNFTPQALAGVVEDLDITYDLVDSTSDNVQNIPSLPTTINGVTYTSTMIKKVNVHMGVRSETLSRPTLNYVRNHITTGVGVRSLASMDRYDTSSSPGS